MRQVTIELHENMTEREMLKAIDDAFMELNPKNVTYQSSFDYALKKDYFGFIRNAHVVDIKIETK